MDLAERTPQRRRWISGARAQDLRALPLGSLSILSVFLIIAIFGGVLSPYDPLETNIAQRLIPPALFGGTWTHVLGTDQTGRDILSRILVGSRTSLIVATASLAIGAAVGVSIGIMSGYAGGKVDAVLMRATDLFLSFPTIVFALLLTVVFGPATLNVVIAIALILWSRHARLVRGQTLVVREQDYVAHARVSGGSALRICWTHVLPNVVNPAIVLASLQAGHVILIEASLSFLGAGIPPPTPAWGSMVALGREYVFTAWWIPTMPGLAIMLVVLSLNMLGDWTRDRFDPRLRNL